MKTKEIDFICAASWNEIWWGNKNQQLFVVIDTHRSKTVNKNITKKCFLRLLFALFEFIVFLKVIRSAFKLKALSYPDHLFILKVDG